MDFRRDFVEFAVNAGVLRFGAFKTKAGRMSPYFFNAGLFSDGASLARLCGYYADAVLASSIGFDMLFGPAYKGIPLVAGIAVELARRGRNVPFCFNRKETKDHGEGGMLIGAVPKGRVLVVDDVISAGTSVRESVGLIRGAGAVPCGVAIALDRMEKGQGELSAVQEVERVYGMPVISVATLDDLVAFLRDSADLAAHLAAVEAYRSKYGVHAVPN
ncbi:MAG TPA: orotate phosphoribosyltransferase [Rhodocyclaceae bacterium]|jgi:orotate phosphoribosyltransferase|nr:orotate phosphoribosyltransferase [Rhodocyclaceae bacterium]